MDYSSIPLGSMNSDLLFLLDDCYSALVLVRQPIGNRGPEDSPANNCNVPIAQLSLQSRLQSTVLGYIRVMGSVKSSVV